MNDKERRAMGLIGELEAIGIKTDNGIYRMIGMLTVLTEINHKRVRKLVGSLNDPLDMSGEARLRIDDWSREDVERQDLIEYAIKILWHLREGNAYEEDMQKELDKLKSGFRTVKIESM